MDPAHRDRIAFVRVCSGRFERGMVVTHGPTGKPPQQMADSLGVRDLTGADWMARRSKELVDQQVRKGSSNGRMPAFTGALKEEQIQAVVQYVMELKPAE